MQIASKQGPLIAYRATTDYSLIQENVWILVLKVSINQEINAYLADLSVNLVKKKMNAIIVVRAPF